MGPLRNINDGKPFVRTNVQGVYGSVYIQKTGRKVWSSCNRHAGTNWEIRAAYSLLESDDLINFTERLIKVHTKHACLGSGGVL